MNSKDQRRDQRNLMKTLKSNDYEGVKLMMAQKTIDLNFIDNLMHKSPLMMEAEGKKKQSDAKKQDLRDDCANIFECYQTLT